MKKSVLILGVLLVIFFSYNVSAASGVIFGSDIDKGLWAYWPFDADSGSNATKAVDIVGSNNGSVVKAWQLESAVKGQAYKFNGTDAAGDGYINFGNPANLPQSTPFTVSLWVYPSATNVWQAILEKYNSNLHNTLGVWIGTSSKFSFTTDNGYTNYNDLFSSTSFGLNRWYHIVVTWDGAIKKVYLNGSLENSNTPIVSQRPSSGTGNLYAGVRTPNANHFTGVLDEIGIWNRSLNSTEVAQIYNYYAPNGRLSSADWKNLKGEPISQADVDDTVALTVSGLKLNNKLVNYTIKEQNGLLGLTWLWPDFKIAQTATFGSTTWLSHDIGRFYFNALISELNLKNTSANLDVSGNQNSLPESMITAPESGLTISTNYSVDFIQSSSDKDDLLNLEWDFVDGSKFSIINYSLIGKSYNLNLGDVKHNFSKGGIYTVELTAKEMNRDKFDIDSIKIYVLQEGINVVPVISQPKNGISLDSTSQLIDFNASGSYVANCSKGAMSSPFFIAGDLNCKYLHAPGAKITSSGNITMNWTLTTEGSQEILNQYGDWSSSYNDVVEFTEFFRTAGRHVAYLDMRYELK
jgi:hypothetical protein